MALVLPSPAQGGRLLSQQSHRPTSACNPCPLTAAHAAFAFQVNSRFFLSTLADACVCPKTCVLIPSAEKGPRVCVSPCEQTYGTIPTGARGPTAKP